MMRSVLLRITEVRYAETKTVKRIKQSDVFEETDHQLSHDNVVISLTAALILRVDNHV